jgi:type IV fimbrial biogenesis protein FimT
MIHSVRNSVSCRAGHGRQVSGMTFIELLTTVSIAAILLALAVPAYDSMLRTNRFATLSNTFLVHLHLARSEALRRNSRVALCKSANGLTCATSGDWSQGWLVFHDVDNNAQVGTGEAILQVHEAIPSNLKLTGNPPVANYVSYASTGGAKWTSGAFQAGSLTLCQPSASGGEARRIVISSTGRPRVEKTTVATCP